MQAFFASVTLMTACAAAHPATAALPAPQVAECVAVLKADSQQLATRIRLGEDKLRPALMERLRHGATLIGLAYLAHPEREVAAKAQLEAAEVRVEALADEQRRSLRTMCSDRAREAFDDANFLSREVVKRLASARMARMLPP